MEQVSKFKSSGYKVKVQESDATATHSKLYSKLMSFTTASENRISRHKFNKRCYKIDTHNKRQTISLEMKEDNRREGERKTTLMNLKGQYNNDPNAEKYLSHSQLPVLFLLTV